MDLGAGLFVRPEREPERRRQMGFGLAGLRPRFPRHVEQLVLLDHVEVQRGARHSVGPGRGAADGLGPDAADRAAAGHRPAPAAGPTGSTESVSFSPAHTRFITATRSAMPRIVWVAGSAPTAW